MIKNDKDEKSDICIEQWIKLFMKLQPIVKELPLKIKKI